MLPCPTRLQTLICNSDVQKVLKTKGFEISLHARFDPNRLEILQWFLVLLGVTVDGFSRENANSLTAGAAQPRSGWGD